ncbi:MAG TPA: triose-phosphate isomerase [Candidatus Acidoferrales bacterium]|nr:triose-phosphate isomerase [Candidatus Acidoferrales bacterium]
MQRRTLIVGNWKMHKTIAQARELVAALLADKSWQHPDVDVVVAPPFTALAAVSAELRSAEKPWLGAQTMHWAEQGAYTGEISPVMLLEMGCKYVILGHSERRADEGETDLRVNMKVKSALKHGITPIIAVGESVSEHEQGRAKERVCHQILAALDGIDAEGRRRCVLAYEPIWAIGSGLAEDPHTADDVMGAIRYCDPALASVRILYGGSMKPNNAASLVAQPNIDGGLVGGASLDAKVFAELIRNARPAVAA